MTPERAAELLSHRTTMRGGWTMRTIECSDIRKHMTAEEDNEIRQIWAGMPGNTCYADALARIARGET